METGNGRATYTKGENDVPLPSDLTIICEVEDAARGETYVTVEGPKLPPWRRGESPWSYRSQREVLRYYNGGR